MTIKLITVDEIFKEEKPENLIEKAIVKINEQIKEEKEFGQIEYITIASKDDYPILKNHLGKLLEEAGYQYTLKESFYSAEEYGFSKEQEHYRLQYNIIFGENKNIVVCTNCKKELKPVSGNTKTHFENALIIGLYGGYSMFVESDDITGDDNSFVEGASHSLIFCHDCAHELCEKFPGFEETINPFNSHSHTYKYINAHPEHKGWDTEKISKN